MGISRLRAALESAALEEDIHFIIPHPFLPPRFHEICQSQNLILMIDRDLTSHVRWEGDRLVAHHPLTKAATRQLIREVLRKMKAYRRELEIFDRFVEQQVEEPFDDDRYEAGRWPTASPPAEIEAPDNTEDKVMEISAEIALGNPREMSLVVGGSSPLPDWDW